MSGSGCGVGYGLSDRTGRRSQARALRDYADRNHLDCKCSGVIDADGACRERLQLLAEADRIEAGEAL
jgi:hypothetical protein